MINCLNSKSVELIMAYLQKVYVLAEQIMLHWFLKV